MKYEQSGVAKKEEYGNMASFNTIIIVGYLGRDPELRYTPQGKPVCDFSVATTERRKDRGGEMRDLATWFKVTLWGSQAEFASKYLTKGQQVYVEGRVSQRDWQDKEGVTRTTLEVAGSQVRFLGQPDDAPKAKQDTPAKEGITDEDIPF